jgi:hypothetical protein
VVTAFLQAGGWALASISICYGAAPFGDVLLTLVPLVLAGVVTLEICVLIRMPLNFANIIALPLLLGIGVAFKIYFMMAWRSGRTKLLQSSLTRAVIFSAMTTATAFGSLWFSSHPGTASMGKLLALSLACTLAAAVLFQPALMGKPGQSAMSEHSAPGFAGRGWSGHARQHPFGLVQARRRMDGSGGARRQSLHLNDFECAAVGTIRIRAVVPQQSVINPDGVFHSLDPRPKP